VPLHQEVPCFKNTEYHIEIKNARGEKKFCHGRTHASRHSQTKRIIANAGWPLTNNQWLLTGDQTPYLLHQSSFDIKWYLKITLTIKDEKKYNRPWDTPGINV